MLATGNLLVRHRVVDRIAAAADARITVILAPRGTASRPPYSSI